MSRVLSASALALSLIVAGTAAQAQSYTAPAGIPASAAPGGSSVVVGRAWSAPTAGTYNSFLAAPAQRGHRGEAVRR